MRLTKSASFALSVAAWLALIGQAPLASGEPASPPPAVGPDGAPSADSPAFGCVPGWAVDAAGIRRLPDRCGGAAAAAGGLQAVDQDNAASCEPPWFVDWRGIRRIKAGCLEPAAAARAEVPAPASAREGAGKPAATAGCEPPFFVDEQGIQRIKRTCLDAMGEPARVTAPAAPVRPAPARSTTPASKPGAALDDCKQPFYQDAQGIRRLRMNCL